MHTEAVGGDLGHVRGKDMAGRRNDESYRAKTEEAKRRQLSGLRQYSKKVKAIDSEATAAIRTPDEYAEDPIGFIEDYFYVIEGRKLIELLPWQKDILTDLFLRKVKPNLAVIGQPKKTGKSSLAAAVSLWFLCTKPMSEVYLLASDVAQSQLVCFDKLIKSIRMNPRLRNACHIKPGKGCVEYEDSFVQILAPNTSVAGVNPSLIVAEELWSWTTLEHKRSWDELTNVPTREENLNLVTSYAGHTEEEDCILWQLYAEGIAQAEGKSEKDKRFYFRWFGIDLYNDVPWVKPGYLPQQKKRLRENAFLRLHCNQWASGLEDFIDAATVDAATNPDLQRGRKHGGPVCIGLDVGPKHDTTGVVVVGQIGDDTLGVIDHAVFVPPRGGVLDLEGTFENLIEIYQHEYNIRTVYFDPYQAIRSAQALKKKGVFMMEFPQTVPNLVKMADTLQGLLKSGGLMLYESKELRQHILNARVKEHERGWRLVKGRQSRKIDLCIALAMAVQAATDNFLLRCPVTCTMVPDPDDDDEDDDFMWHEW